jgi:hypothetical protein
MHKHAEVAIKNWALSWTDAGHRRRQNRRMTAQIRSKLPRMHCWPGKKAVHGPRTGSQMELGPVIEIWIKMFKCSMETFATRESSKVTQISLFSNNFEITAR